MTDSTELNFPSYVVFANSINSLELPLSGSQLHGIMCGYLCAGANHEGLTYLRALTNTNSSSIALRNAELTVLNVYAFSEQQIRNFDFNFKLMLPEEDTSLMDRAEAFSEWCRGFIQGLKMSGVKLTQFDDEDSEDAFKHLEEFADLDCRELSVGEEDEKALMEVSEYTRMAVLKIYADLFEGNFKNSQSKTTH